MLCLSRQISDLLSLIEAFLSWLSTTDFLAIAFRVDRLKRILIIAPLFYISNASSERSLSIISFFLAT